MEKVEIKKLQKFNFVFILAIFFVSVFFLPSPAQATYRDTVEADTPLYYWPMDEAAGATSLTAAVGGTAINLTGATAGASGQVDGTAVSFDGNNDSGVTASNLNLTSYNKLAVEAVVFFNSFSDTDNKLLWIFGSAYNTTGNFVFAPNSTTYLGGMPVYHWGGDLNTAIYTRPSATWHHVVAIYDKSLSSNEVNFYIDGTLQTPSSRPGNYNSADTFGNLLLHLMSKDGATFYGAKMQHLAIYNSLSSSRILAHYEEAFASSYTTGVLSESSHSSNSATVSWTNASGGTAPITAQLQRSPSGAGTWSNVSGATASPVTDTGLGVSTAYDYRVAYTDATPTTIYSNTVTITTDAEPTTTYTVQAADLWDNGYDNISTPLQSNAARLVFTTNASSITVTGYTTLYNDRPLISHLGLRINGVDQSPLAFTQSGSQSFVVNLGTAGTSRTIEIVAGHQTTLGLTTVLGSFISSVQYPDSSSFTIVPPVIENRILIYGDSIAGGSLATNPESEGWAQLLRNYYTHSVMLEAWGNRALYDDTNTAGLRSAFVSRLASYSPSIVWFAIGVNDYGYSKWSAASFGTAYAATLDSLHTALPSAKIVCQTPLIKSGDGTLGDYRAQITTICNARSWTTLIDGTAILTTSDLSEGLHPTTAGHAKYALKVNDILTITPTLTTSAASSVLSTSATLNGSISNIGSTTPTVRGFTYGLTTAYEIATTTDSGSFSTGNFNAPISNLTANTIYHFRSYATNLAGTAYGADQPFTTALTPTYTIGGTISGLTGTVVLQNNGGDNYSTSTNGSFVFATALNNSASYSVTVSSQPTGQTCTIGGGTGTVSSANVTSVTVNCVSALTSINSFNFASPATTGTINNTNHTVALSVPYGTNVTSLTPTIAVSTGATISPTSGTAENFTSPQTYTVTAQDGVTTQAYTVTVTVAANTATSITSFNFTSSAVTGTVDNTAHTVSLTVSFGTTVTSLTPTIVLATGATISPNTGVAQNFTSPVTYTVTAQDGTTNQAYTATVTVALNTAKALTAFDFNALTPAVVGSVNEGAKTITLTVPFGTSLSNLVPTITINGSSVSPLSGVAGNFTTPQTYTVTAADSSHQDYVVTVNVAANTVKAITAFDFDGLTPAVVGTVNETDKTIALTVPYGTAVTALVPTITITGASVSPVSLVAQSFSTPATYIVTAANASTQPYTVTVTVAPIGTHTITASSGANGSISPSGSISVNNGSDQAFTIIPNSGYHIDTVTVDGGAVSATSPYTFTSVTADHTISATFAADVVVSHGGGGFSAPYPTAPAGGFTITRDITNSQNKTVLHFGFGNDITNIAISENIYFTPATYINATSSVEWTATTTKILYVKYCNRYGRCSNPISLQINAFVPIVSNSYKFYKNLSYRMTNSDVKELQKYLNTHGFIVAPSGAGSPGKETTFFGSLTRLAVIKFQEKYAKDVLAPWGFVKGTGYVGKTTLAKINELIGNK
jgi:hypothetical protein